MADFRLALALAGKGPAKDRPDAEQLNTARYYLCFLYYEAGQYYDAAVLGDFLARHAADKTPRGAQGAKIVLASYIKLYGDSKQADKSFEDQKNPRDRRIHPRSIGPPNPKPRTRPCRC